MIDVKEVICGDPECAPIDTLVTIGENAITFNLIDKVRLFILKNAQFCLCLEKFGRIVSVSFFRIFHTENTCWKRCSL